VAYFERLEDLQQASEIIRASTSGISVQGVPFSASIGSDGLVSWGIDPPRQEKMSGSQLPQSWRQWVSERIAVYIVAAKESGDINATETVLSRLTMDGLDTKTWTPNLAIWRALGGFSEELS
jgi:hypothetical protein